MGTVAVRTCCAKLSVAPALCTGAAAERFTAFADSQPLGIKLFICPKRLGYLGYPLLNNAVHILLSCLLKQAADTGLLPLHHSFMVIAATLHAGSTTLALPFSVFTSIGLTTTLSVLVKSL